MANHGLWVAKVTVREHRGDLPVTPTCSDGGNGRPPSLRGAGLRLEGDGLAERRRRRKG